MLRHRAWCFSGMALALSVLFAGLAHSQSAGNTTANLVLGQVDFSHDLLNFGGLSALASPAAIAVDSSDHIYVVDQQSNRVLGWKNASALKSGAPADLVVGQPDPFSISNGCKPYDGQNLVAASASSLCFPSGAAVDSIGNLYVADTENDRVLEFDQPFESGVLAGEPASVVFGQHGSMTSNVFNNGGISNDSLSYPWQVAIDSKDNLYVADQGNGRVLEYNTPLTKTSIPGSGDTTADLVFGNVKIPILGNQKLPAGFFPIAVALDGADNLYVLDNQNYIVLEYNTPLSHTKVPGSGDTVPDRIVAELFPDANCQSQGQYNPSAQDLCLPTGVAVDSAGNVYVADQGYNRVTEYNAPIRNSPVTGASASRVFGQSTLTFGQSALTTSVCSDGSANYFYDPGTRSEEIVEDSGPSARGLCAPQGVAVDSAGDLWVADTTNHRVLEYYTPLKLTRQRGSGDSAADLALGQIDVDHNTVNLGGAHALNSVEDVALDAGGHLYAADGLNNRILGWKDSASLTSGAAADIVIGQPDFFANQCRVSRTGLCLAIGALGGNGYVQAYSAIAVDGKGNLYVVDYNNNRVVEYDRPFESGFNTGQPAHLVFGQNGSVTTRLCGIGRDHTPSADTLCGPAGVAVDPAGNVYITDSAMNRMLEYNTPLERTAVPGSGDTTADLVFGAGDLSSSLPCRYPETTFAYTLCEPAGVAADSAGNVFVADSGNCRVLEYNNPVGPGGATTANLVFGQGGSFTSSDCTSYFYGDSVANADQFATDPDGVAIDGAGNLYVSDTLNNRILEYNTPLANPSAPNTTPNLVFGQGGSFTSHNCAGGGPIFVFDFDFAPVPLTSGGLCYPQGLSADSSGNLWVADTANSRVLEFASPTAAASTARR